MKSAVETLMSSQAAKLQATSPDSAQDQKHSLPAPSDAQPLDVSTRKAAVQIGSEKTVLPTAISQDIESRGAKQMETSKEIRMERILERELAKTNSAPQPVLNAPNNAQISQVVSSFTSPSQLMAESKLETSLGAVADVETLFSEPRQNALTTAGNLGQILSRPDTPAMIGRQMAEALQKLPDKPVEISLNPRELGRVRMSISASEAGIVVNVLAERQETLDLMRRHIDQLAKEFQSIGYENISFSFSEGQSGQTTDQQQSSDTPVSTHSALEVLLDPEEAVPRSDHQGESGLDLRM